MPFKVKVSFKEDHNEEFHSVLKISVPKSWLSGPTDRVKNTFVDAYNAKDIVRCDGPLDSTTLHLVNAENVKIPPTGLVSSWMQHGSTFHLKYGAPDVIDTGKALNKSYDKWAEMEKDMVSDDDEVEYLQGELSKKKLKSSAEKEVTNEILEWTQTGEKLRNMVKQQWSTLSGQNKDVRFNFFSISNQFFFIRNFVPNKFYKKIYFTINVPFSLLLQNLWDAQSPDIRKTMVMQAKKMFVQMYMLKADYLSMKDRFSILGATTIDPESWNFRVETEKNPITNLFEMLINNKENDNINITKDSKSSKSSSKSQNSKDQSVLEIRKISNGIQYILNNQLTTNTSKNCENHTIEALTHAPLKRLQGHSKFRNLFIEWLLTLRTRFLCEFACCYASVVTFHIDHSDSV